MQLHTQDGSGYNDRPEAMSMSTSDALAERCVEIDVFFGTVDGIFRPEKRGDFFFEKKKHGYTNEVVEVDVERIECLRINDE